MSSQGNRITYYSHLGTMTSDYNLQVRTHLNKETCTYTPKQRSMQYWFILNYPQSVITRFPMKYY